MLLAAPTAFAQHDHDHDHGSEGAHPEHPGDAPEETAGEVDATVEPPTLGRGDADLLPVLSEILRRPAVAGARMSILIEPAEGGAPYFALEPDMKLHPASNTKLVTSAAALVEIGPTYRYETDLVVDAMDDAGRADNVFLIGRGDPRFVSESLWKMVDEARVMGLRAVRGDVIVDDSFFAGGYEPPGFGDKKQDSAYRAPSGAASLNFNSARIVVLPGPRVGAKPVVTVLPDSDYAKVQVTARTVKHGRERLRISAVPDGEGTRITVAGRIPIGHGGLSTRRRIDNPPRFAGLGLKHFLEREGITVGGAVRLGKAPARHERLARHWSPPLSDLLADVNKLSNNFMAEQVLRTLGRHGGGSGDWKSGQAVVSGFLTREVGLKGFKYVNGSGLFGDTAFSARDMVTLLRYMQDRRPFIPEYASSLAIAGGDGTLRSRMRKMDLGTLRAKTGTLDGVVCLSGYVDLADGSPALFSVLMNSVPGSAWNVWKVHDALLEAVAAYDPPKRPRRPRR